MIEIETMFMRTYLVSTLIVLAIAAHKSNNCDIQNNDFSRMCYKKEIIATINHSPNQIAVDRRTNNIFFSFDSGQGLYSAARTGIGIPNSTIMVLKGIKDAFAMAYEPQSGEMYFGGSSGIYRYNPKLKKLKRLIIENLDIWWLVVNLKDIYFIKFPSLSTYKYENKKITYMEQLKGLNVHQFVFDINRSIVFINSTGLYGISDYSDNVVVIKDHTRFLGLATDNNGQIYVCSEDAIYVVGIVTLTVRKIMNIRGVLGMTFDQDNNLVYSDAQNLVRLILVKKDANFVTDIENKEQND